MEGYNNDKYDIDSVGTEYSDTSRSPNPNPKQNISVRSQKGGNLEFLFGNNKKANMSCTETTAMLIKAIETKRYQAADFIIEQKFVPDMGYANCKKENLFHVLVNARNDRKDFHHVDHALKQLIENPNNRFALNVPDENGMTPFFLAVQKGHMDLARYMEKYGAKKTSLRTNQYIMTDRDDEMFANTNNTHNMNDKENIQIIYENNKSSNYAHSSPNLSNNPLINKPIFLKPQKVPTIVMVDFSAKDDQNDDDNIKNIVKGFITKSASNDTDAHHISPSDSAGFTIPVQYVNNSNSKNMTYDLDEQIKKLSKAVNPTNGIPSDQDDDEFVEQLTRKIVGLDQDGGARKKSTKSVKSKKLNKIVGTRNMIGFSELSDTFDLFGGTNDNEMRTIARAVANQKDKLHEEAIEKILANLPKKDMMTARAVKAIIYEEVKNKHKEMSGLDKAAEMMRLITKSKVTDVLKQKEQVDKIVAYLEHKYKDKESKSDNKTGKTEHKKKDKKISRKMKRPQPDFESSLSETSDYETSDESSNDSSYPSKSSKSSKSSKKKKLHDF